MDSINNSYGNIFYVYFIDIYYFILNVYAESTYTRVLIIGLVDECKNIQFLFCFIIIFI